jgi:hypothetical protein
VLPLSFTFQELVTRDCFESMLAFHEVVVTAGGFVTVTLAQ